MRVQCLVASNSAELPYSDLLAMLVNPVMGQRGSQIHKQVLKSKELTLQAEYSMNTQVRMQVYQ